MTKNQTGQKVIFEGAELTGKSYLMSQIFDAIEPKYNSGGKIMDGCHWFNCDVGIFGTRFGSKTLQKYLELLEELESANCLVEKFHLSEFVYQKLYNNIDFDYSDIEARLKKIGAKIVLVTFDEDEELVKRRLNDRLQLYPHYSRIAQNPADYIKQQQLYLQQLKRTQLDHLIINASQIPNHEIVGHILDWLGEK